MQDWIHKNGPDGENSPHQKIERKTATALGLATHYYRSVDSDVRLNDPLKERTIEETR